MDRKNIANSALMPLDWLLGKGVANLENLQLLEPASDVIYQGLRAALKLQYKFKNELDIDGIDNIPQTGGVLLAANHQSWLDASVLGAVCPRKIHFIAKSEFQDWPVVRHLIRLGESIFIKRGGDHTALETITEALRAGWVVAIFPEGTIPGEEEIPRRAVDPRTGLLPGHTGVVRLALAADVPIVPVGISGTGRALPPEVYPRLELLRLPSNAPIRIRFGEPIRFSVQRNQETTRALLREFTDDVMQRISGLVDHLSNYAPIQVPIKKPPRLKKVGVLVLHGFTSHLDAVSGIAPHLKAAGIPYAIPILRGHGTRYQDLNGVTAKDWFIDAERALIDLWTQVDQVIVVGFSMGGVVALDLAMRHPAKIAGVVSVAAALKFTDPLARFARKFAHVVKYWDSPSTYNDETIAKKSKNYKKFPTETFASLYEYAREITDRLDQMHVPVRILQSKKDQVVAPVSANIILEKVSSRQREIFWYHKSGHEMMQDVEAEQVFKDIMEFVVSFQAEQPQANQMPD
ncbi:MAG: alpha/beta fold hydrolase [Myxococcota bacterium]|nr:alpha/beta fold hydrolase [Myxococcota bacterium]